jgi:hypothetical protein
MSALPTPVAGSKRVQAAGAAATLLGIIVLGLAVPGLAHADSQAAASSAACTSDGWTDTVTVTNSPDASDGAATISGTGTGLDGLVAAAGGGQQSVTIDEPLSVTSVTVAGTLSWPGGFTAPFTTTAAQPDGCGASDASVAAGGQQTDSSSAANTDTTSAADTGAGGNAAADVAAPDVTTPADTDSVTLCHATDSDTNPYVVITVDAAGAFDGHYTQHQGPIWNATLKDLKIQWGDIIPPFVYHGVTYSENWNSVGQAILAAGCQIPGQPAPTTTVTSTETTTATATVTDPGTTVTVTDPGTTVTVAGPTVTVTDPGTTVTVAGPVITTTEEVPVFGPTETQTVTETVAVAGESTSLPAVTKTATVVNCPPGAQVQGGSLAYTGGNNSTMSLLGGALTAGGLVCLIMARRRRAPRTH